MKTEFISTEDKKKITYYVWEVPKAKAVVHIVHGSIEYALRYEAFAKRLNKQGYSVYAMDVRGHGETGKRNIYGYFGNKNGYKLVWSDVHRLNNIIKKKQPKLKIVLLGHSMGSFIVRSYVTQYNDVDMLIPIGTNQNSKLKIKLNKFLISLNSCERKGKQPGAFFNNISYKQFSKSFKNETDPLAWMSKNKENRIKYKKSEFTRFIITNRGFLDMVQWMDTFTSKRKSKNISSKLPILLLNGSNDPVGSMGKEVSKAQAFYKNLNFNSQHIEYKGMRHEILNETNHAKVENDIFDFISKNL